MDVHQLAQEQIDLAHQDPHGRSAQIVVHDGPLRQTVIALRTGTRLAEHNSPPAGSILVLRGTVAVSSAERVDTLPTGFLATLTHDRHGVEALSDAAILLTTVTGTGEPSRG
ncbi:cupin [Cellulomonas sp. IC4_254]|uniref:cupin n=1 Tax=Cellulomonas sp. IC4_254 TaxID=2714040 RepID=UPI0014247AFF|nr:cupin [Cellulomonas sp. IC4_254]NHT16970.1 cupin [Cellulomonas sp. IC4_254]